jgi:hypothetical protein
VAGTHRTFPPGPSYPHISYVTWLFMRRRIAELEAEVYRLTVDRDTWYARANYTPEELHEQHMRASQGRDPETGEWLWPDGVKTRG